MERPALATRRARALRRDTTDVGRWLWGKLRDRRLGGHRFVRRMPVGPFFADLGCRAAKLSVELDGAQHAGNPRDELRDASLVNQGYGDLRFWNHEVTGRMHDVCETIPSALDGRLAPYDRCRTAPPQDPSSGPSGHLLPCGEKGANPKDRARP